MATENAFTQDDDPRKKKGTQDPLFYEGKTPVLGADVSVQEPAGELAFPEAGGSPPPAPAGAAPTRTPFPEFPEFNLERPEFNFTPPTAPKLSVDFSPPDSPWWAKALQAGDDAYRIYSKGSDLYKNIAGQGSNVFTSGSYAEPGMNLGTGGLLPDELQQAPADLALGTGGVEPGDLQQALPAENLNLVGPAISALGAGLGAYNAYMAPPGSRQQISSAVGSASGMAGLVGSLLGGSIGGAGLAGGLATASPVLAAMTLPFVTGALYERYSPYYNRDKIQTPPGWQYVPGTGNNSGVGGYLVDPKTGHVVQYEGKGKYTAWGNISPEQAKKYGIEMTGEMAKRPEFAAVNKAIRDEDITQAGQPIAPGGAPRVPSQAHQQSYLENWRQPYIDQIRAQHPNDPDSRIWWYYTQSPWYQQELNLIAQWGATGQPGGGGEAEGSGPSGPGDRAGDLGGGLMG